MQRLKSSCLLLYSSYDSSLADQICKDSKFDEWESIEVKDEVPFVNSEITFVLDSKGSLLKKLKWQNKKSPLFLLTNSISLQEVKRLAETKSLRACLDLDEDFSGLRAKIDDLIKDSKENSLDEVLIKEDGFEKQLKDLRLLNQFTKKLSSAFQVEELLIHLKKELRKRENVKSPILYISNSFGGGIIYHFQGASIVKSEVEVNKSLGMRIRANLKEDSEFLASVLNRPTAKVVSFPITDLSHQVVMFFEHDLKESMLDEFINFLGTRLQSISIILDLLLIEEDMRTTTLLWEKTFEGISDPVAIIDRNFDVVRANSQFSKDSQKKCYLQFANRSEPCPGCKLLDENKEGEGEWLVGVDKTSYRVRSYPIAFERNAPVVGYINHYSDLTTINELKSNHVQNEKMVALGQLSGHLAHELNNPLTGIRALTQLLQIETKAETLSNDLKEVEKAAERCQSIILNLQEFTKSTSGELVPIDPNETAKKTIPLLKSALRYVNLEENLCSDEVQIWGEPQLFQQAIFNLMINAAQASKNGGRVSIKSWIDGDNYLIKIEDTGVGINEDSIKKVFQPFFTTKPVGEGTGLGLSIVQRIVNKFMGRIELESQPKKGTRISLIFPLIEKK